MKNRSFTSLSAVALGLAAAMLLVRCSIDTLGGNSSQAGNPLITGALYDRHGSGAKNALVTFVPVNFDPRSGLLVDSAFTDDRGGYHFDSLPSGVYNVFGKSGDGLSYRHSFRVPLKTAVVVPADTLKAPGSVKGVVRLLPGDDSRTVFIIVMGTTVFSLPGDATGNFELTGMAEGSYNVRLLSTLSYKPLDTVFAVAAGRETLLSDTIRLISTAIPTPEGLKSGYDSLLQIVTLAWNKPAVGRAVKGYNVFRKHPDSNMVMLKSVWPDTVYADSNGTQDVTYSYQVAAVDSQGTEGVKSAGVSVRFNASLLEITGTIVKGEGPAPGQFSGVTVGRVAAQGHILVMDRGTGRLQELDSAGNCLFAIGNLVSPAGFEIGPGKTFYTLEPQLSKITRYDTGGVELAGWNPQNVAKALLLIGDTLLVLTDKGIEMYDTSGNSAGQMDFILDFSSNYGGDFAMDSSGTIYLIDGVHVFSLDKTGRSITPLYPITDFYHNQNPKINCIGDRYILISTVGARSPFTTSHYLVSRSGTLVGRWYSREAITDITVKNATTCIGFTADGKIITLTINCPEE